MRYFANLAGGKAVLWCYLIWYVFFATRYFEPNLSLWLTSAGISGIVGIALVLSTADGERRLDPWQLFRLFLMPFCVSSFSALVKGRGFILVFSSRLDENIMAMALCGLFCAFIAGLKFARR